MANPAVGPFYQVANGYVERARGSPSSENRVALAGTALDNVIKDPDMYVAHMPSTPEAYVMGNLPDGRSVLAVLDMHASVITEKDVVHRTVHADRDAVDTTRVTLETALAPRGATPLWRTFYAPALGSAHSTSALMRSVVRLALDHPRISDMKFSGDTLLHRHQIVFAASMLARTTRLHVCVRVPAGTVVPASPFVLYDSVAPVNETLRHISRPSEPVIGCVPHSEVFACVTVPQPAAQERAFDIVFATGDEGSVNIRVHVPANLRRSQHVVFMPRLKTLERLSVACQPAVADAAGAPYNLHIYTAGAAHAIVSNASVRAALSAMHNTYAEKVPTTAPGPLTVRTFERMIRKCVTDYIFVHAQCVGKLNGTMPPDKSKRAPRPTPKRRDEDEDARPEKKKKKTKKAAPSGATLAAQLPPPEPRVVPAPRNAQPPSTQPDAASYEERAMATARYGVLRVVGSDRALELLYDMWCKRLPAHAATFHAFWGQLVDEYTKAHPNAPSLRNRLRGLRVARPSRDVAPETETALWNAITGPLPEPRRDAPYASSIPMPTAPAVLVQAPPTFVPAYDANADHAARLKRAALLVDPADDAAIDALFTPLTPRTPATPTADGPPVWSSIPPSPLMRPPPNSPATPSDLT